MRLNLKRQVILVIGLMTLFTIAVTAIVIWPTIRSILHLEASIGQLQVFLEQQFQKTHQLRRSTQAVDAVMLQIKKFDQATMKRGGELRMITRLEQLAAAHNIDQTLVVNWNESQENNLKVDKKNRTLNQPHFTFSFLNHGRFTDLQQFLRALEGLPEYFVIRELNWEKRQYAPNSQTPITLRFDADVYVLDRS